MDSLHKLEKRIDDHDVRLRVVENHMAVLPRIEEKIDKLSEKDYQSVIAVMREQAKVRDREIEILKEKADQTTEKFWKVAIIFALLLGALQGIGIDIPAIFTSEPIQEIVAP